MEVSEKQEQDQSMESSKREQTVKSLEALWKNDEIEMTTKEGWEKYWARKAEKKILDKTIMGLMHQAPFLTDSSLLSEQVSYSCPLDYKYGRKLGSATTDGQGLFSSVFSRNALLDFMRTVEERSIGNLDQYTAERIKTSRVTPNVLTCEWVVSFNRAGHHATVFGTSTYFLKEGKVSSIQETWKTQGSAGRRAEVFLDSLDFQLSRRPVEDSEFSQNGFLPGYQYAAWEALRSETSSSPSYNMSRIEYDSTREVADKRSMRILKAFIGSSGGLYLGSMYSIATTLQSMFEAQVVAGLSITDTLPHILFEAASLPPGPL